MKKNLMENLIPIKKSDVDIFRCPQSIHLDRIFKYFIFDQSFQLLCSVTAAISLIEYLRQKDGMIYEKFSVGFLYHQAMLVNSDFKNANKTGLKASSVVSALIEYGTCTQNLWSGSDANVKPSEEAILDALSRIKHCNIENIEPCIETIRYTIGFSQRPIVTIMTIFDKKSFFGKDTSYNIIGRPLPDQKGEDKHSILLVGYDDNERVIYFQNSYGDKWGNNGFGRLSYDYIPYLTLMYSMDESCIKSCQYEEC